MHDERKHDGRNPPAVSHQSLCSSVLAQPRNNRDRATKSSVIRPVPKQPSRKFVRALVQLTSKKPCAHECHKRGDVGLLLQDGYRHWVHRHACCANWTRGKKKTGY